MNIPYDTITHRDNQHTHDPPLLDYNPITHNDTITTSPRYEQPIEYNLNDKGDLSSFDTCATGVRSPIHTYQTSNIQRHPSKQRKSSSISHITIPHTDLTNKYTCGRHKQM